MFQIKALSAGLENLILVSEEIQRKTFAIGNKGGGGVNNTNKNVDITFIPGSTVKPVLRGHPWDKEKVAL
jgi:protein subunit release factor A